MRDEIVIQIFLPEGIGMMIGNFGKKNLQCVEVEEENIGWKNIKNNKF